MVTHDVIQKFRERANRNDFVLNKYRNHNGKNQWNCICSAMDWITVAVSYFKENPTPTLTSNDDLSSVGIYTYISCVDMIFEAVKQLHRVFIDPNGTPFYGEKGVFRDNVHCKDDNSYFKLIRACFGAHPVDLKDYFQSDEMEQRFASWSGGHFSGRDYGVILYSSQPDGKHLFFDISFRELEAFLERTYGYLEKLIPVIDADEKKYIQQLRKTEIHRHSDPCVQLKILDAENKRRYDNDYYKFVIEQIKLFYETPVSHPDNRALVEDYRNLLRPAIEELFDCLQDMRLSEVETFEKITPLIHEIPHSAKSGLTDLADYIFADSQKPMIWLPSLVDFISPYVEITGNESVEELYVLSKVSIYHYFQSKHDK